MRVLALALRKCAMTIMASAPRPTNRAIGDAETDDIALIDFKNTNDAYVHGAEAWAHPPPLPPY